MNKERIIKISNGIGLVSIVLLIYWVFIFISITVFGLKIFRENITEVFYLSIIGILALMFGALMINIMFNLTKISAYINKEKPTEEKMPSLGSSWMIVVSFPIIFIFLFAGDRLSSIQKEKHLIRSASYITKEYADKIEALVDYSFTEDYLKKTEATLDLLSKIDRNFPYMVVITRDNIDGTEVFLSIRNCMMDWESKELIGKINYVYAGTKEENEYLKGVFYDDSNITPRFSSHDGNYELFYPVLRNGEKIVIYFSEHQRYGKIGS
ncbi:hypothetical protein DMA11_00190 [Marinilabiliaceae bacterium JC017]|nr:hypothetical protein DMA11_00190 [Marinilabiliaceae bacterium JC017]